MTEPPMERDDRWPLLAVPFMLAAVAVLVVVMWVWPGPPDEVEPAPTSSPVQGGDTGVPATTVVGSVPGEGWPVWPTAAEVRQIAWELAPEAVSSMAVELADDGSEVVVIEPTAPVAPAPAPVPAPEEVRAVVCGPFAADCERALRVVECESTFRPDAVGGAGERGWFQVHPVHRGRVEAMGFTWEQMFDPVVNTAVAHSIWAEQGWGPWTCQ